MMEMCGLNCMGMGRRVEEERFIQERQKKKAADMESMRIEIAEAEEKREREEREAERMRELDSSFAKRARSMIGL